MELAGLLDPAEELKKLSSRAEELSKAQDMLRKRVSAAGYLEKVTEAVREEDTAKSAKLAGEAASVAATIRDFEGLLEASK